jgi:hypothetical protein
MLVKGLCNVPIYRIVKSAAHPLSPQFRWTISAYALAASVAVNRELRNLPETQDSILKESTLILNDQYVKACL